MQYIPSYAARKNGREPITYIDERLRAITSDSQGICIYQEQYMLIAKQMAGFTPAESETLRRAIGKKIHELMASLKGKFLDGCAANNVTPSVANQLWKDMESSQDYSFNKAHSVCYALIAYRTAWLKANYPCEYMAALISSVMNTKDRVPIYVNACDEMGIDVLPPDVNESATDFAVVEGKIRFGLNAVKNVGDNAARAIIAARNDGGPFTTIWEFTERVDPQVVNKRALESLVKCGALDSTGASRMGMLGVLEQALAYGQKLAADRLAGQGSIFDMGFGDGGAEVEVARKHHPPIATAEFEKAELLRLEKETLGLYVSEHPLSAVRDQLRRKTDATLGEIERRRDGEVVTVGGIISAAQAPDDEEGRADGLPPARGSHRLGRNRRLLRYLLDGAGAVRRRPDSRRQGPRRPQAGGGDEADRARADGRSKRSPNGAMCGSSSTLARPLPARSPSSHGSSRSTRASHRSMWHSRRRWAPERSLSGPATGCSRIRISSPRRRRCSERHRWHRPNGRRIHPIRHSRTDGS